MEARSTTGSHDAGKPDLTATQRIRMRSDGFELSWRILQILNIFRVVVSGFLLALYSTSAQPHIVGNELQLLFVAVCGLFLGVGFSNMVAVARRWPSKISQAFWGALFDTGVIVFLTHASGGVGSGLASLLIVSVGANAMILPRRLALLIASLAALAILGQQAWSVIGASAQPGEFTAAGLLSAILLTIAWVVEPLARRIQDTEALAKQRGVDLANLAELNQYIVQHLRESIVVIDTDNKIRLMNASAADILGSTRRHNSRHLSDVSPRLYMLLQAWRRNPEEFQQAQPSFVAADGDRVINPQFAPLKENRGDAMLVFLEDTSLLAEKVQQTKLASLGRLTASIAHEVRNPVGAMSHAAQLLRESAVMTDTERRLTDIIHNNGQRVSQIIDNVLQLSRRDSTAPERLSLKAWLTDFADEFCNTQQLSADTMNLVETDPTDQALIEVLMDPSHLHQVLWNLCDNAVKYAGGTTRKIELRLGRQSGSRRPYLEIVDFGPGIDEAAAERIFEPFYTGKDGGTGLGLFICRELCECNRATLLYQHGAEEGSVFRITFSDPQRWENSA